MFTRRFLHWRLIVVLLIFGVLTVSQAAFADADLTAIHPKGNINEGKSGFITFKATATDPEDTFVITGIGNPMVTTKGDQTDALIMVSVDFQASTCKVGGTIGLNGCLIFVDYKTNPADTGPRFDATNIVIQGMSIVGHNHLINIKGSATRTVSDIPTSPVPEPSNLLMMGIGLVGLVTMLRRKLRSHHWAERVCIGKVDCCILLARTMRRRSTLFSSLLHP
jgi:hypothetical protein